jgi:hypothetical protein
MRRKTIEQIRKELAEEIRGSHSCTCRPDIAFRLSEHRRHEIERLGLDEDHPEVARFLLAMDPCWRPWAI